VKEGDMRLFVGTKQVAIFIIQNLRIGEIDWQYCPFLNLILHVLVINWIDFKWISWWESVFLKKKIWRVLLDSLL
jgi:hypothetical protein